MVFALFLCFLVPFAGVHGAAEEEHDDIVGLINVTECEGVAVTQCEVAKNLINTLKMGEDLTCGACFIHLKALGIAPGEDWSYEDPHKVITQKEIEELIFETHRAYNDGTVRSDGFEAAGGINDFCRDMKGPTASASGEQEEEVAEMEPAEESQDQDPATAEGVEPPQGVNTEEDTPPTTPQEPAMQEETNE
jgi:hypothetical protein